MKALTVCCPYSHFIALGLKPIENRTWATSYRGTLLIHAGLSREWLDDGDETRYPDMAFGAIVAHVTMVACLAINAQRWPDRWAPLRAHEHANGPYCHVYEHIRRLPEPVPCKGAQGLWTVPSTIIERVREQLRSVA